MEPAPSSDNIRKSSADSGFARIGGAHRKYAGLGMQAGMAVVFYTGAGVLLDRWLDTLPLFTVIGALLGVVGMFYLIIRTSTRMQRENEASKATSDTDS